jgi:proline iminopeptidase
MAVSGSIDRDGFALDFVRDGRGIPLLILGSPPYYQRAFPASLRSSFDVVYGNLRIFVSGPAGFNVTTITRDTYSDDIEALRVATDLQRPIIVGHSICGLAAIAYARRYPANVAGVVLVGAPPIGFMELPPKISSFFDEDADAARLTAHQHNLATRRVPSTFTTGQDVIDNYIANGALYWCDPTFDCTALWEDTQFNFEVLNHLNEQLYGHYDLEPLNVPVLIVHGRYDYVVPYRLWDEPRNRLPQLTYHLYDGSGHTPQYEEPDRFTADITAWAQALNGTASA